MLRISLTSIYEQISQSVCKLGSVLLLIPSPNLAATSLVSTSLAWLDTTWTSLSRVVINGRKKIPIMASAGTLGKGNVTNSRSAADSDQLLIFSPFESDLIQVIVGIEGKRTFTVHRDIICQASPFFKKCLGSGLSESSSKTVSLPEDKPAVFEVAVRLAYGSPLNNAFFPKSSAEEQAKLLIPTYILADKLGMESLGNDIMDRIKSLYAPPFSPRTMFPIYWCFSKGEVVLPECKLRTFFIECLVSQVNTGDMTWVKDDADFYALGGSHISEVVCLLSTKKDKWIPPWSRVNCEYHSHLDTVSCAIERLKQIVSRVNLRH